MPSYKHELPEAAFRLCGAGYPQWLQGTSHQFFYILFLGFMFSCLSNPCNVVILIIDSERVFSYRALRISRNDKTPLPGFDENNYVDNTNANKRGLQELLTELSAVRHATLLLFKSFSDEQLARMGLASENEISVRAIGFIIIGHQKHHQKVFEERYL